MIDVEANRKHTNWSSREMLGRMLWSMAWPLFRFSPRVFWGWRRLLLRLFGAIIGRDVHVYPSVRISMPWNLEIADLAAVGDRATLYALGQIKIGTRTTISQNVHVCAGSHDWRDSAMPLLKLPITIGAHVWICADAFIGPGVEIGDQSIIGARAVVMKDVATKVMGHGNPFQIAKIRDDIV